MRELDKECFPKDAPCDAAVGKWWLLLDGRKVAGYASLRNAPHQPGIAYLNRAGVVKEYRGRGLQKRLIRVRLAYAKRHGYKEAISDSASYNVASSNSLIACGFKLYRPRTLWSFRSALYWFKTLR
jgi:ribosomal protein S18 acetylase RimI-like enzyme